MDISSTEPTVHPAPIPENLIILTEHAPAILDIISTPLHLASDANILVNNAPEPALTVLNAFMAII